MKKLKKKSKKTEKKIFIILFLILGFVFVVSGFLSYVLQGEMFAVIRSLIIGFSLIIVSLFMIISSYHNESSRKVSEQISKKVLNPSSKNDN